jgi:hypothetical protein
LLALLERHVPAVTLPPGRATTRAGRVRQSFGRGAEGSWRRSAAGGGDRGLRPRRADKLELASASFFVFLSLEGIFMARAVRIVDACAAPAAAHASLKRHGRPPPCRA